MTANTLDTKGKPPVSNCHKAPLKVISGKEGTSYWICSKCEQPADPYVEDNRELASDNTLDKRQTIEEYKTEGLKCLDRFKQLLNKNEHTRAELDELAYIDNKFGKHPMFIQARKDNYDARANSGWGGFGSPNCQCHISPPCENCVAWTNFCEERKELVDVELPCLQLKHDCPIGKGESAYA